MRGTDARIIYDAGSRVFRVRSMRHTICFRHESQAYYACKRGVSRRLDRLGEDYFLPQIDFSAGDVVVDCGANVGELYYWFVERGSIGLGFLWTLDWGRIAARRSVPDEQSESTKR